MMLNSAKIRDAAENDVPEILNIELLSFSEPWTEEMIRAQVSGGGKLFLVARLDDVLAGYIGMMHVLDEGYISNIAVLPEFRRRGFGSGLIDAVKDRSLKLGLSFITLEVRESNLPARGLYLSHGFCVAGRRRNYYENPREDAVLMTFFINEVKPR